MWAATRSTTWTMAGAYNVSVEAYDGTRWSGLSNPEQILINKTDGVITIESPGGDETWTVGSTYDITWNSIGYVGEEVVIGLCKGDELNRSISGDIPIPNSGSYQWQVDQDLESGNDYIVAISCVPKRAS